VDLCEIGALISAIAQSPKVRIEDTDVGACAFVVVAVLCLQTLAHGHALVRFREVVQTVENTVKDYEMLSVLTFENARQRIANRDYLIMRCD
jgi:hypothetical protein